jgi:3-deoxy-D-manno-octulosonate 8-phosphate phosphatase (KDO 8-P phosphatase)
LAKGLTFLLLDVDGVMTDGGIIYAGEDRESKRFDVQDGMGINLARIAGLKVGIVTSRESVVVTRRAAELNIDEVFQGIRNKLEVLTVLAEKYHVKPAEVAYIGDDIQDISIMDRVGMPIAVQNALPKVKEHSLYVTGVCGGHGAVREAVEWLLDLRGDIDRAYLQVIKR